MSLNQEKKVLRDLKIATLKRLLYHLRNKYTYREKKVLLSLEILDWAKISEILKFQ